MNRDALISLLDGWDHNEPERDADAIIAALMMEASPAASVGPAMVVAPWTEEEVAALAAWQASGMTHSYTCGICRDRDTQATIKRGGTYVPPPERALVPTPDGWTCQSCDFKQNWALASSLLPPPTAPWLDRLAPGTTVE